MKRIKLFLCQIFGHKYWIVAISPGGSFCYGECVRCGNITKEWDDLPYLIQERHKVRL